MDEVEQYGLDSVTEEDSHDTEENPDVLADEDDQVDEVGQYELDSVTEEDSHETEENPDVLADEDDQVDEVGQYELDSVTEEDSRDTEESQDDLDSLVVEERDQFGEEEHFYDDIDVVGRMDEYSEDGDEDDDDHDDGVKFGNEEQYYDDAVDHKYEDGQDDRDDNDQDIEEDQDDQQQSDDEEQYVLPNKQTIQKEVRHYEEVLPVDQHNGEVQTFSNLSTTNVVQINLSSDPPPTLPMYPIFDPHPTQTTAKPNKHTNRRYVRPDLISVDMQPLSSINTKSSNLPKRKQANTHNNVQSILTNKVNKAQSKSSTPTQPSQINLIATNHVLKK